MIPNKHFILHVHHNIKNIEQKVILIYIYIPLNRFALNVKKNWTQKKRMIMEHTAKDSEVDGNSTTEIWLIYIYLYHTGSICRGSSLVRGLNFAFSFSHLPFEI